MSIFSNATNFPVGKNPNSVVVGDFNKDGKPDIATSNNGSNNISILLGTGTGSFGTATNFNIGLSPISLALGDFNSDGNLDIASMWISGEESRVAILLGNGTGGFGTPTSFDTGAEDGSSDRGYAIGVGDLNSDGKLDLATIHDSGNISTLLGTGTGSFGAPIKVNGGDPFPRSVVLEDFNADGKLDLAVTDNSDTDNVWLLLGTGTGNFGAPTKFDAGSYPYGLATGDFNGDNKPDIAVANLGSKSNNVSILLGTGTGSFGAATNFNAGTRPGTVAVGDFNSDNKSDLAVANDDGVSILLGNGTGSFGAATNFGAGKNPYVVAVADFNADGKTDLVTTNYDSNNVSVLLNKNDDDDDVADEDDDDVADDEDEDDEDEDEDDDDEDDDNDDVADEDEDDDEDDVADEDDEDEDDDDDDDDDEDDEDDEDEDEDDEDDEDEDEDDDEDVADDEDEEDEDNDEDDDEDDEADGGDVADGNDDDVADGGDVTDGDDDDDDDVADGDIGNEDNDAAGIFVSLTETEVTEGGANDSYKIELTSQPTASVTIALTTGNQIQSIAPLTFTANNWDVAQTVTVKAVNDTIAEGTHSANITHTATSTDARYNGIAVPRVRVAIDDNDTATNSNSGSGTNSSVTTEEEIVNEAIVTSIVSQSILHNFLFTNLTFTGGDLTLGAVGPSLVSGSLFDGYISGATVFLDANKNGVKDADEPSTTTNSNGEYKLEIPLGTFDTNKNGKIDPSEGNLVGFGGTDTATGLPLETPFSAPADATVISPLTSLVTDLMAGGMTQSEAESKVKSSLSIPGEVDLLDLDPIASTSKNEPGSVETLVAMTKVQNIIIQTSSLIDGASTADNTAITKAVVETINSKIKSGGSIDLSNASQVESIIQQSVTNVKQVDSNLDTQKLSEITPQAAKVMAGANQSTDQVKSNFLPEFIPSKIAQVQKVALGESAIDLEAAAAGTKPIADVVWENTGESLRAKIQGNPAPSQPAVPIVEGDIIEVGNTEPEILGEEGKNLVGTDDSDTLIGGSGNDFISGRKASDSLDGGLGNDSIYGGKGLDTLTGGSGDDILFGGRGTDNLDGGEGNDSLYGGKANDTLLGGLGDDFLSGENGDDFLTGGSGNDRFLLNPDSGSDTILDFEVGIDKFALGNGLTFQQLEISQTATGTLLKVASTGQLLATVTGLNSSINASDFGLF
jgi:FG-GAP-like repeat/RTX calcium-binding nonapeptide repeat (4 copies)